MNIRLITSLSRSRCLWTSNNALASQSLINTKFLSIKNYACALPQIGHVKSPNRKLAFGIKSWKLHLISVKFQGLQGKLTCVYCICSQFKTFTLITLLYHLFKGSRRHMKLWNRKEWLRRSSWLLSTSREYRLLWMRRNVMLWNTTWGRCRRPHLR